MKTCIILNGEIDNYTLLKEEIHKEDYDYVICADGGANHAFNMDIIPNYILGDLDSIEDNIKLYYDDKKVDFKKFPTKKDETDSELSIYLAKSLGSEKIDFYGALGGRIDHTIANVGLLNYTKELSIEPRIVSNKEILYIVTNDKITVQGNENDTISVIPIKGDAKGVTLRGLEYPLNNYNLKYSTPMGISNVMLTKECEIEVADGTLLVIKNK